VSQVTCPVNSGMINKTDEQISLIYINYKTVFCKFQTSLFNSQREIPFMKIMRFVDPKPLVLSKNECNGSRHF